MNTPHPRTRMDRANNPFLESPVRQVNLEVDLPTRKELYAIQLKIDKYKWYLQNRASIPDEYSYNYIMERYEFYLEAKYTLQYN